jgi:mercuric ion transport protein
MQNKKLITTGIVGTIIAALCCFTSILVILFGAIGLAAAVGYLDYVQLPSLAFFVVLTLYALWRYQQAEGNKK